MSKKMFALSQEQLTNLLKYLATRPYQEVAQAIQEYSNLPLVDVTYPEPTTPETIPTPTPQ